MKEQLVEKIRNLIKEAKELSWQCRTDGGPLDMQIDLTEEAADELEEILANRERP